MPASFDANGKIQPDVTERVLEFADEIFAYVMNELEGGDWQGQFNALSENEKAALFAAIADGFNDEIAD